MAAERLTDEELAAAARSMPWTGARGTPLDVAKRAVEELREARELLELVEWCGSLYPAGERVCPVCRAVAEERAVGEFLAVEGNHTAGCRLGKALGR